MIFDVLLKFVTRLIINVYVSVNLDKSPLRGEVSARRSRCWMGGKMIEFVCFFNSFFLSGLSKSLKHKGPQMQMKIVVLCQCHWTRQIRWALPIIFWSLLTVSFCLFPGFKTICGSLLTKVLSFLIFLGPVFLHTL